MKELKYKKKKHYEKSCDMMFKINCNGDLSVLSITLPKSNKIAFFYFRSFSLKKKKFYWCGQKDMLRYFSFTVNFPLKPTHFVI